MSGLARRVVAWWARRRAEQEHYRHADGYRQD